MKQYHVHEDFGHFKISVFHPIEKDCISDHYFHVHQYGPDPDTASEVHYHDAYYDDDHDPNDHV